MYSEKVKNIKNTKKRQKTSKNWSFFGPNTPQKKGVKNIDFTPPQGGGQKHVEFLPLLGRYPRGGNLVQIFHPPPYTKGGVRPPFLPPNEQKIGHLYNRGHHGLCTLGFGTLLGSKMGVFVFFTIYSKKTWIFHVFIDFLYFSWYFWFLWFFRFFRFFWVLCVLCFLRIK